MAGTTQQKSADFLSRYIPRMYPGYAAADQLRAQHADSDPQSDRSRQPDAKRRTLDRRQERRAKYAEV